MNEEQIEAAVEYITEEINDSRAMNPTYASQQESVDFLGGIIEHCQTMRQSITHEMAD